MISAAVKGLARLAYEFSDLVSSAYKLLPSTFLLLQRKNREIIKVCSLSSLSDHIICLWLFPCILFFVLHHLCFAAAYDAG